MRAPKALGVLAASIATAAAVLTACASGRTGDPAARASAQADDIDRIRAACEARGGMLLPSGQSTGRAALDNHCRITSPTQNAPPA